MLDNKQVVSSLDNSICSPKKKSKKVEAKSQQIPKDFLGNEQENNSRNNIKLVTTALDDSETFRTQKKIKLINKQNTP